MSAYREAIMMVEDEALAEAKRDETTHEAVIAALNILDAAYPEFKKSDGPFGDELAGNLHRAIEAAFNKLRQQEEAELATLESLKGKYRQ